MMVPVVVKPIPPVMSLPQRLGHFPSLARYQEAEHREARTTNAPFNSDHGCENNQLRHQPPFLRNVEKTTDLIIAEVGIATRR
jgi:hypothetical protein